MEINSVSLDILTLATSLESCMKKKIMYCFSLYRIDYFLLVYNFIKLKTMKSGLQE